MSTKTLIDGIRIRTEESGAKLPMSRARDLIACLLFDRSYSASIAAERAGGLARPELVDSRTEKYRKKHGVTVDIIVEIAVELVGQDLNQLNTLKLPEEFWPGHSGSVSLVESKFGICPVLESIAQRFRHTQVVSTLQYMGHADSCLECQPFIPIAPGGYLH